MNMEQATDLYDLAAGLRAVTTALVEHTDDDRPAAQLSGLALSAKHLAGDLAAMTWELLEDATVQDEPSTEQTEEDTA